MDGSQIQPQRVVTHASSGSIGIAYTYNEPLVGIEFVEDCCKLAKSSGLKNVLVTNGYVVPEPVSGLLEIVDAVNVDIKSMEDGFYKRNCGGKLQPVLDFCVQAHKAGCHIEITNLIVPGQNNEPKLFYLLGRWIASNLGKKTVLHLSAYYPTYKMDVAHTPLETLEMAYDVCSKHLDYVYLGNTRSRKGADTMCPSCGKKLISRMGYSVEVHIPSVGICPDCKTETGIIGE